MQGNKLFDFGMIGLGVTGSYLLDDILCNDRNVMPCRSQTMHFACFIGGISSYKYFQKKEAGKIFLPLFTDE